MRAFFSIPVPVVVAERLLALVPPMKGLRRARSDSLHLTLHFVADGPPDLDRLLSLPALPPPFRLIPGRLILLPESGPVAVVAASIGGDLDPLRILHAAIASELTRLGVATDPKRFLPHITLARASPPLPQQIRSQTPMVPREDVSFEVPELVLIETRPAADGKPGVEHVRLKSWPLT